MKKYLKGALHVHTNISDGLLPPQEVVAKLKSKGYDFIVFTDHGNNFNLSDFITDDMGLVLIPGVEINQDPAYHRNEFGIEPDIHMNALGVRGYNSDWRFIEEGDVATSIEKTLDLIRERGGVPTVNHPNWLVGMSIREMVNVNRDFLMEIGAAFDCCYGGNHNKESLETMWDILLTKGKKVYGVFTDDSHRYNDGPSEVGFDPGYNLGYVEVFAERDEKSILEALTKGEFYASNGIYLDEYTVTNKGIKIKVKPDLESNGHNGVKIEPHEGVRYAIMFKGKMGMPLKVVYGTEAEYTFDGNEWEDYVRVKVVSNKTKDSEWQVERWQYYEALFTQPVFK
ncbi:MAG: CehA/McbA family metallohydrolase [Abditibacteriota bacterium]|nr:CehA/McbA family metallohydrolase [Abditibacteriota bacterium]